MRNRAVLMVLAAMSVAAPAFAGCPDWTISSTFESESMRSSDVLVGDVNGDGARDVVTFGAGLHVAYGGPLGFARGQKLLDQLQFATAALADFNHDGRDDVVLGSTAAAADQSVVILISKGNGQFEPLRPVSDILVNHVAAANLDGDPFPDLVLIGGPGNELITLINDGHGSFASPLHSGYGAQPTIMAIGDLDGDGRDDVVVIDPDRTDVVRAYLNDGHGNLRPFASATLPSGIVALTAADFEGDGRSDVAAATVGGEIVVLRSLHTGLTERARLAVHAAPSQLAAADFDRDGGVDLAIADKDRIIVLLNDRRTFRRVPDIEQPRTRTVLASDFTGDQLPDLVVRGEDASLSLRPGAGDGTFRGMARAPLAPIGLVRAADLDGDGDVDLVLAGLVYSINWADGDVTVMLNEGGTLKGGGEAFSYSRIPTDLRIDDMDGDGRPEILVASTRVDVLHLRDGKLVTDSVIPSAGGTMAAGDFDGDGRRELAVSSTGGGGADLYTFTPEPRFVTHIVLPPDSFLKDAADFDGDGRDDLLVVRTHFDKYGHISSDGFIAVLPSLGHGFFGDPITVVKDLPLLDALIGDFDGDGRPDVAIEADDIRVAYSAGRGFDVRQVTGSGLDKVIFALTAVADVDGDGRDELFGRDNIDDNAVSAVFFAGRGAPPRRITSLPLSVQTIYSVPMRSAFVVAEIDGNPGLDIAAVESRQTVVHSGLCPGPSRRRAR